jgi:hypothetical protein
MNCFTLITGVSVEGTRMNGRRRRKRSRRRRRKTTTTTTTMEPLIVLITGLKNVRLCN